MRGLFFCLMTDFEIQKLFYPIPKRNIVRKSRALNDTNNVWNEFNLGSRKAIGCMASVFFEAQSEYERNGGTGVIPFEYFENYYLYSGRQRKIMVDRGEKSRFHYNYDYGRTLSDLYELSVEFEKHLKNAGFDISFEDIFNYVYIRTLDESYIGFYREYKVVNELRNRIGGYEFAHADAKMDVNYSIDIAVYRNKVLVMGYQVKTRQYMISEKDYTLDAKRYNERNFERCLRELGFKPEYLFVDPKGNILQFPILEVATA